MSKQSHAGFALGPHRRKNPATAEAAGMPRLLLLPIADLRPDPCNPRRHSRQQVRAIARSMTAFGFNAPVLIDNDKRIIAGHGRYEAAKLLGYMQIPTLCLAHLSKTQARAYMVADNKLNDRSAWDDPKLAVLLKELSVEIPDLEVTGFEAPEIDLRIQSLDSPGAADADDEFRMAEGTAVSTVGDLWHLNGHRLYCGSALEVAPYAAIFSTEKAAAIFADPPYNVKIDGHVCGSGAIKHREFAMAAGEMNADEYTTFLSQSLTYATAHSNPGAIIYCCMDWRHIDEILAASKATNCALLNLCVWAKDNGGLGSFYRSRHELVFVFRNGKEPHCNNVQLGRFGRNRTNVWNYPGVRNFGRQGHKRALEYHPTVKPTTMVADAILDSTKSRDIVLDPFIGSGTTLLASERTGRRCYGIELDPLYVDTAIYRWEQLTGNKVRHSTGEGFKSLAAKRQAAP